MKNIKGYIVGFILGISFISGISYASTSLGTIGGLFTKVGPNWKLVGTNIQDSTIGANQLGTNSVTTIKILNGNVTEEKLSTTLQTKINSSLQVETDPTAVKLTGNQTVNGVKTFTNNIVGVNPIQANHLVTKQYVDDTINGFINTINSVTSWYVGEWSSCSTTCGGGVQNRVVQCKRFDGTIVADSNCSGVKPSTSQICNSGTCTSPTCPSRIFNVPASDHPSWGCSYSFPSGTNLQILTRNQIMSSNSGTAQCINGNWNLINYSCVTGGND